MAKSQDKCVMVVRAGNVIFTVSTKDQRLEIDGLHLPIDQASNLANMIADPRVTLNIKITVEQRDPILS